LTIDFQKTIMSTKKSVVSVGDLETQASPKKTLGQGQASK
jgi:hypothetical protein